MRKLDDVTLVCVTSTCLPESIMSLRYCMNQMSFGEVKLITHFTNLTPQIDIKIEQCRFLNSKEAYSHFIIFDLHRHINTKYCLIVQHDGYIVNADSWDDIFYNYDYIGAPWPLLNGFGYDPFGGIRRVGNGGFSFRSKKLLEVSNKEYIPFVVTTHGDFYRHHGSDQANEDYVICVHNAHLYENYGCVFAPYEVACKFSREFTVDMNLQKNTFGIHRACGIWIPEHNILENDYFI